LVCHRGMHGNRDDQNNLTDRYIRVFAMGQVQGNLAECLIFLSWTWRASGMGIGDYKKVGLLFGGFCARDETQLFIVESLHLDGVFYSFSIWARGGFLLLVSSVFALFYCILCSTCFARGVLFLFSLCILNIWGLCLWRGMGDLNTWSLFPCFLFYSYLLASRFD